MGRGRKTDRAAYVIREWNLPEPKAGRMGGPTKFYAAEEVLRDPALKDAFKSAIDNGSAVTCHRIFIQRQLESRGFMYRSSSARSYLRWRSEITNSAAFSDFSPGKQEADEVNVSETPTLLNQPRCIEVDIMPKHHVTNLKLDHTHCRAICDEIGERLQQVMRPGASPIPPYLLTLMDRFKQLEMGPTLYLECSPSIEPTIDEMSFPRLHMTLSVD